MVVLIIFVCAIHLFLAARRKLMDSFSGMGGVSLMLPQRPVLQRVSRGVESTALSIVWLKTVFNCERPSGKAIPSEFHYYSLGKWFERLFMWRWPVLQRVSCGVESTALSIVWLKTVFNCERPSGKAIPSEFHYYSLGKWFERLFMWRWPVLQRVSCGVESTALSIVWLKTVFNCERPSGKAIPSEFHYYSLGKWFERLFMWRYMRQFALTWNKKAVLLHVFFV